MIRGGCTDTSEQADMIYMACGAAPAHHGVTMQRPGVVFLGSMSGLWSFISISPEFTSSPSCRRQCTGHWEAVRRSGFGFRTPDPIYLIPTTFIATNKSNKSLKLPGLVSLPVKQGELPWLISVPVWL